MLTGDILRRSAHRFPDKPAIVCGDRHLSYTELNEKANQFAHALLHLELGKGAKVAILSRNLPEYGVAFFGAARSGYVLVNVSVLYAPDELRYVLDKADVEALFCEDMFSDKVAAVLPDLPRIKTVVTIGDNSEHVTATRFRDFIAESPTSCPDVDISEDDPFCMTYTGGTTGRPKGVLASHRGRLITAHTVMVEEAIDERDMVGIVTPMFHIAALNIMFAPAILAGASTTFLTQWSVEGFQNMVSSTGMTAVFMVPTQANVLVSSPEFDAKRLETWRKVSFAGAPMPDWVQKKLREKLPQLAITQIYGQSEVGVIAVLRDWYVEDKLGSIGRQAYNVDIALVDADGTPAKPGEIGELVSRGANLMLEYYNEPEQTSGFFKLGDGWGWTGDLATIDEDGFITLVDRSKEMIISGGENIYPKTIEDVLYLLEPVGECAVFGIPDEKWGEVPAAYIQLKPDTRLAGEAVEEHCAQQLARFKRPRLIKFVDDFPKTPIGKIQKNLLKEPYWKQWGKKI